jgi:serine phosphatase RsbU (regulator of sigma subunit)
MLRKLLSLLLCLLPGTFYAQLSPEEIGQVDSLKTVIELAKNDTVVIKAWKAWDDLIYAFDPELDIILTQKIDSLAGVNLVRKLTEKERQFFLMAKGKAINILGIVAYERGQLESALSQFKESVALRKEAGDSLRVAGGLNNIGSIYHELGNYALAINYYTQSLKIKEENGNHAGVAGTLNNIAIVYEEQEEFSKALEYFMESLRLEEEFGTAENTSAILNNIGIIHKTNGDYDLALEFYERSLSIGQAVNDQFGVALSLSNIGLVYQAKGAYVRALDYHNQALKIRETIADKKGISHTLNNMGDVYAIQGNKKKAIEYSAKALVLAQEVGSLNITRDAAKSLWMQHKESRNYREALNMHELFIAIRDSAKSEENHKEVVRQQLKYTYDKQAAADSIRHSEEQKTVQAEMDKQRAVTDKQEAELAVKRIQQYALFGGVFFLVIFLVFIISRLRKSRQQNAIIRAQKREVDKQRKISEDQRIIAEEQKHIAQAKNKQIVDSINYAKRLQNAILPPLNLMNEKIGEGFVLFQPKDIVSGDFYWMESCAEASDSEGGEATEWVYFAAADCTGHGVPGAMVSVICSNALSKALLEEGHRDTGKLLDRTRALVMDRFGRSEEEIHDGMDISLCALNRETNELRWSGAYNPLWIIRKDGVEIDEVVADKQPIGMYRKPKPFTSHQVKLNAGDTFYIFTDGFTDQFGGENKKKFMSKRLKHLLLEVVHLELDHQKESLASKFKEWMGDLEQLDDVCVIGVRI